MMTLVMTRRLLAIVLVMVVLDPLAPLAGLRAAAQPCSEHVCQCVRHCPPKRSSAEPCHESSPAGSRFRATCEHGGGARLASVAPAVLPPEVSLAGEAAVVLPATTTPEDTAPGFEKILAPPPKRS
jgi:hypothetical protein